MNNLKVYHYLLIIISITLIRLHQAEASFGDYVNSIGSYFSSEKTVESEDSGDLPQKIPYEVSIADEKFISEAAKLTGVALSELDSCQHRVVLKLRTDCDKMNDEQVAKMGVHLLNCQSYAEGRTIFPCTDDMSIKRCTENMDSDTWTSYHLMSNRAKAVCYSIRQTQFRGLAEHTVNSLMNAARDQLNTLRNIAKNQHDLRDVAEETFNSLTDGQKVLSSQQKDMEMAQMHGQLILETNINKLAKEKELIVDTHNQLIDLTQKIQQKLEYSSNKLEEQAGESRHNHQELLNDLITIQNKTHVIFQRIEESSKLLLQQNENFKNQYQETIKNLAEVNQTVHNLMNLMGGTRLALEERLAWLSSMLGGTDSAVERLYLIIWHLGFIMIAMLTCAFLSANLMTRIIVATLPPINLSLSLWESGSQLTAPNLAVTILSLVLGQMVVMSALSYRRCTSGFLTWKKELTPEPSSPTIISSSTRPSIPKSSILETTNNDDDVESETDEFDDNFNSSKLSSLTPPISRNGFYKPRSRSHTPLLFNSSLRGSCAARTRAGTPCKLSSLPGRDFCYRHQTGDSVLGS